MAVERNNSAHDFETMLSLYLQRRRGRGAICENFDSERANGFVEGILASAEASRYEEHLSMCSTCRQAVTELKRMALSAEPSGQRRPVSPEVTSAGWFSTFVDSLRAAPLRWGVAAAGACAIVLAIMTFKSTNRPLYTVASPEPAGVVSMASPAATPRSENPDEQIARAVRPTQSERRPVEGGRGAPDRGWRRQVCRTWPCGTSEATERATTTGTGGDRTATDLSTCSQY